VSNDHLGFKCRLYQWFLFICTCAPARVLDSRVHVDQIVCSHARWLYRIIWEVCYCVLSPHEKLLRTPLSLSLLSPSAPSSVDEELLTEGDGQPVGHPYIHHKKLLSWIRHRKKPLQTSGSNLLESKYSEAKSLMHECFFILFYFNEINICQQIANTIKK